MNQILAAEHDIKSYLFYEKGVTVNFVTRQYNYKPMTLPNDYALQCTTKDGCFQAMTSLVGKLGIIFKISEDNAFLKCIVLKDKNDVLKIASHIQEVKL